MSNYRPCVVSFTDLDGITHSVEVSATSLYEAAALGLHQFQSAALGAISSPGPGCTITVSVKAPVETHQLTVERLNKWLNSTNRGPAEMVMKNRLKELLGKAI